MGTGQAIPNCSKLSIEDLRNNIDTLPALIDTPTVAALGGISERKVQRMAKAGKLPCVRIGRHFRFNTAEVLARFGLR